MTPEKRERLEEIKQRGGLNCMEIESDCDEFKWLITELEASWEREAELQHAYDMLCLLY